MKKISTGPNARGHFKFILCLKVLGFVAGFCFSIIDCSGDFILLV